MTWQPDTYGLGTRAGWSPSWAPPDARPGFAVDRTQLLVAADAVTQAITRLQCAQETEWKSVAADHMRTELYGAIQGLRAISTAIDDALDDVGSLNFSGMYGLN